MTQPTGPDYYLAKKAALLKQHGKLVAVGTNLMRDRYGEAFTQTLIRESQGEFEGLIPEIPYIGGRDNPLTDTLEQMTSLLALYRVMKQYGKSAAETGELTYRMAQAWVNQYPSFARRLIGRLYVTHFWRRRTQRLAQARG